MAPVTRRQFLIAGGMSALEAAGLPPARAAGPPVDAQALRSYGGASLAGWETIVGDATHPGQPAVLPSDIATEHMPSYSEVRANVLGRPAIMAHNLTLHRFADLWARRYIHTAAYSFRLPYTPVTTNRTLNGQTIEGALGIWDGQQTQQLRSVGFQWIVNPYWMTGALQVWTAGGWQLVGFLPIDMSWHRVELTLDPFRDRSQLRIDGVELPSSCVTETKPGFGVDVAATLSAEAISLDPGTNFDGGMEHRAQFRDWSWTWAPAYFHSTFLPAVARQPR